MEEIWRDVKDYIGLYQVSNWGRVKSIKCGKEKILKPGNDKDGYLIISLYKNGIQKTHKVHHLVWDVFGDTPRNGHKLQVDHKNLIKSDNRIDNLQLLNCRANSSKKTFKRKKSSQYIGVSFNKKLQKWTASIEINGKQFHLGVFSSEEQAKNSYQYALTHQEEITNRHVKEKTSKYKGVSWNKRANKWIARIQINDKRVCLGYFNTQEEASQAYLKAKENL
jgi:hypothetical protein